MIKIPSAPLYTRHFLVYAGSPEFPQVYSERDAATGRLVNKFSAGSDRPLILGGRNDLDPQKISRMERNLVLQMFYHPVYLFDHHGLAAYGCAEAAEFGNISKGATLFRFDAHPDLAKGFEPADASLSAVYQASKSKLGEDSYVWNLVKLGLVSNIYWFKSSPGAGFINGTSKDILQAFPELKITEVPEDGIAGFDRRLVTGIPTNLRILDIDYDYFKGLRHEYVFSTASLISYLFRQAGLVLQTLSPDYIDPDYSSRLAVDLMKSL